MNEMMNEPPQLWVQGAFSSSSANKSVCPDFMFAKAAPWGLAAGVTYGGATVLQVSAIDDLDYATAYTITQANLVVTGLLGILLFDELTGVAIYAFFAAAVLVLTGSGIVAFYGTTK